MIEEMKGMTPEELNFNYGRIELMKVAKELKIKNRTKVNKIILCMLIEDKLTEAGRV
jgi:hypothetical protein